MLIYQTPKGEKLEIFNWLKGDVKNESLSRYR